jgi:hypothetical protein
MRKLTANVVQETSATLGTGTLTLAQLTGWMRVSDRFSVGDTPFCSIRDGNNWEIGKCTVGASNTLARSYVLETLVDGVVTTTPDGSGTPLTLASGNAIVRAVAAEELLSTLLKVENVLVAASRAVEDGFSYGLTAHNITLALSSAPLVNDRIEVYQAAAGPLTNCFVDPGVERINGALGSMALDVPDFAFWLIYTGAPYGWKVTA